MRFCLSLFVLSLFPLLSTAADAEELIKAARGQLRKQNIEAALKSAEEAVKADPKNPAAFLIRGDVQAFLRKHTEALKDYESAIQLDKSFVVAVDRRGGERFKLGMVKESIEDFDAFLKQNPKEEPGHWRRGISYYYVGKFTEGAKQFDDGRVVFGNDVENAFWHWLCLSRKDGVEKATKTILKVGEDTRVPMMKIYDLILGKIKPAEVIETAEKAKLEEADKNEALFYANLYVGLYYEANGNAAKCKEHLTTAVEKHKISHYMWDVGNVHVQMLKKK